MFPVSQNEADRLVRLADYRIVGTGCEPRFDHIAQLAAKLFSVEMAAITFVDAENVWFKARVGVDACEMPRGVAFCAHTILSDAPMVVPDLADDERFALNPLVQGGPRIRFYAGAPLVSASGHHLGALCIMDTMARVALTPTEEAQLAMLASLVGDHLELRRLELANAIARGFTDATQDGMLCIDAKGIITFVNTAALELFGYAAEDMLGQTLDLIMPERFRSAHAHGVARIAGGAPSKLQGKAVELSALRRSGEEFPVELSICSWHDRHGTYMGAALRDISERKQRDLRLHRLAHHDPLTGLANRLQLDEALATSYDTNAAVAVLLLDLDGFKSLNDSLGHAAGDALLQTLAVRLQTALEGSAIVARIGGDEFAVVLAGIADPAQVRGCAETILSAIETPCRILGHSVRVEMSIGAAIGPHDGDDGEELVASADLALYRAKTEIGSCFRLYEPSMRYAIAAKRALRDELIRAFDRGEFVLHYQPQVRIDTGSLIGAEALLRWHHPERGLLLPGAFMGALDDHILASHVGNWVLDEACRQAAAWRNAGLEPLRMAVNLFAAQLSDGNLPSFTAKVLACHGLRPAELELEITESIALQNDERLLRPLREVRALGVGLAFDDFGTGFASLSTLKRVPLTTLKIDRSFVRCVLDDPHDAAVIAAMVDMGRRLDLDVIAEGIETAEQETRLTELGCNIGQGFHYGRGTPADMFGRHWSVAMRVERRA